MKRIIQITISIVLLGILLYFTDFEQTVSSISAAKYEYLIAALFIVTGNRFLMAAKWKLLLNVKNIKVSIAECTKIYYIGNFLGLFLPPTIGTDIVRSFYIAKKNYSTVDTLASIFIERVLGFIVLFMAALIGFFILEWSFINVEFDRTKFFYLLISLTAIGTLLFIISLNKGVRILLLRFTAKYLKNKIPVVKILEKVQLFIKSYQSYKYHKYELTIFFIFTFCEVFTYVLWSYYIALALNVNVSLVYFVAFVPITLIFIRLPISLDGFGIQESLYVYFLLQVGISQSIGFSIGFINHIITIIGILPSGILYAVNRIDKDVNAVPEAEHL